MFVIKIERKRGIMIDEVKDGGINITAKGHIDFKPLAEALNISAHDDVQAIVQYEHHGEGMQRRIDHTVFKDEKVYIMNESGKTIDTFKY
jgi:hypothetical protein